MCTEKFTKNWTVKNSDSLSVTDFFPHLPDEESHDRL